jgi:hypothetical protein
VPGALQALGDGVRRYSDLHRTAGGTCDEQREQVLGEQAQVRAVGVPGAEPLQGGTYERGVGGDESDGHRSIIAVTGR